MADKTINDLTAATTVAAGDLFELENTGNNSRKITASNLGAGLAAFGGGAVAFFDTGIGADSGSAFAFKGNTVVPNRTIKIAAIGGLITPVSGAAYKAVIADLSSATSTSPTLGTVSNSDSITATNTNKQYMWFVFASPVTLTAGTAYVMMIGRTDSTTNYVLPVAAGAAVTTVPAFPGRTVYVARLASTAPANGNTLDTNTGGAPSVTLAFKWFE